MADLTTILDTFKAQVLTVTKANGYSTDVKVCLLRHAMMSGLKQNEYPAVSVTASGIGFIAVEDATDIRWEQTIQIQMAVRNTSQDSIQPDLLNLIDDVVKLINAPIALGTDALALYIIDRDISVVGHHGICTMHCGLIHVDQSIKAGSEAGTDVYGTVDILQDVLTKLTAEMELLKTAMVAFDPTFGYVYQGHNHANMLLSAVSVDIGNLASEPIYLSDTTEVVVNHNITASVRVHTSYAGGRDDSLRNTRLLNSIMTYLYNNTNLGDTYAITDVEDLTVSNTFDESATMGGELRITIKVLKGYTQT